MQTYRRLPTEDAMERTIREAVEYRRGRCWHVRDSRGMAVDDMPDLIIVIPAQGDQRGIVALLELKSQRRKVTPGQAHVIDMLAECGHLVTGIVRPEPRDGEMSLDEALMLLDCG